jgi:hypothetical protein
LCRRTVRWWDQIPVGNLPLPTHPDAEEKMEATDRRTQSAGTSVATPFSQ